MSSKKKISPDMQAFMRELIKESLRDWFKKEKWVRISTAGNIAGPCGTSKNTKNPDRCLPKAKAQSLTKAQRAATAQKKKKAGATGQQVVKNTEKAKVTRETANPQDSKVNKNTLEYLNSITKEAPFNPPQYLYHLSAPENIDSILKTGLKPGKPEASLHGGIMKGEGFSGVWLTPIDDVDEIVDTHFLPEEFYNGEILQIDTSGLNKDRFSIGIEYNLMKPPFTKQEYLDKTEEIIYLDVIPPSAISTLQENYADDNIKVTREDITNLVIGMIYEMSGKEILTEKDDRCTRIAKRKYDTWPSAYASGAVVRCRRGEIWKKEK